MKRMTRKIRNDLVDEPGRVQVIVQLRDSGSAGAVKGNLMRSLTVGPDVKVSDVFRLIEQAIPGGEDSE